jgi:mRNA-degrading endonuclease toxin of MazEF toxin-antitoxin module
MNLKQGEIYLIEFGPGKGHEYMKMRPGLIVMADAVLEYAKIVSCLPITSADNCISDDVKLSKDAYNNLRDDSVIKMHHLTACDRSRIKKYIGHLKNGDWDRIRNGFKKIYGL